MRLSHFASSSLLALSLTFVATPFVSAQSGTLGHGLEGLVQMYEWSNPKLSEALKPHLVSPTGDVMVQIRLQPGVAAEDALPMLKMLGFQLQAVSKLNPSLMEGYLPLSAARTAAATAGIQHVAAVQRPITSAAVGSVPSQAVPAEKADIAQARGIDGTGTKIGILSDSFDSYGHQVDKNGNPLPAKHPDAADDESTGDLPPSVFVLQDITGGTDEGRAMAQLAHKIAPGAALGFATADLGEVQFANNILDLRLVFRADTICDDVFYFDEPMYSDGIVAQAVDAVVSAGAAYFSSAGNNGLEAYEGRYRPTSVAAAEKLVSQGKENINIPQMLAGLASLGVAPPQSFQTFSNPDGSTNITQKYSSFANNFISLQWNEPFFLGKVKTNFDVYVFDSAGNWLNPLDPNFPGFYSLDDNTKTDEAFEFLFLPPLARAPGGLVEGDYQIVIGNVNNGPADMIKYINLNGLGESERQNAPSVFGHTAARNGQSVGAQFWGITKFPEDFSSPGPVTIYFDDNGNRLRSPEVRHVPQLTAIDGVDTTFFGRFFGTSAAAPDAAAVGALVIQASGGPGHIQPEDVYEKMQNTATQIPLSIDRALSGTLAGPVLALAQEDYTRFGKYFTLGVLPTSHNVQSVSFNATGAGLIFNPNPTRFHIGTTNGITASDVTPSYSADSETLTLSFAPGTFHSGSSFTFGASIFNPAQGSTQEDADRMEGVKVTVTLDNGTVSSGNFLVAPKTAFNPFTGNGLVNADLATRAGKKR